ncbi:holin [Yinghuangia sp. YIM S09857]|uniref:holin n=1 Tax=Yinghuangia sp. YIM S09857 TaxID=3436929 RepID=UPI003F52D063
MPTRAPRRCTTPACPRDPEPGTAKCARCATPRPRPSAAAQGYGPEHERRFRVGVLAKHPTCVCEDTDHGHDAPCGRTSQHADHWPLSKRELIARGMDDNHPNYGRGLCPQCHSKHTAREQPGGWHAEPPPF